MNSPHTPKDNYTPENIENKTFVPKEQAQPDKTAEEKEIRKKERVLSDVGFKNKYRLFRKSGLSRRESLFNAAYLVCHNRYEKTETVVKNRYKSVYSHPLSWSADKKKIHKNNGWSLGMSLLSGLVGMFTALGKVTKKIGGFFGKIARIPRGIDNSVRAFSYVCRGVGRLVLPVCAVLLCLYTVRAIIVDVNSRYSFGIYVDGVYKGNTDNINDVINTKHQYEQILSERYGTPLILDCRITFKAQTLDKRTLYKPGDTSIYEEFVENHTQRGFGLYIDNVLAAVSDSEIVLDRTVNEYIETKRAMYIDEFSPGANEIDELVLSNHIVVMAADYPNTYFLTENELRELFDLPPLSDDSYYDDTDTMYIKREYQDSDINKFSYSLNLDYSKLERVDDPNGLNINNSVPSTAVTVDIAMVRDESAQSDVPYAEEYVYDETLLEGTRRLIRAGENGRKIVHYKATYQGQKLLKREVASEEIIRSPVNKIVRLGTREATEEEKPLIPTGTYIYPYQGSVTSYYGWRKLRGLNDFHQGLDIFGPHGCTLVAADGGEVVEVGYSRGYGKYCIIRHNEEIVTRYAHCSSVDVKEGDLVGQGYPIGKMGATGNVTGVHVHFEIIRNGKTVDPLPYMTGELPYAY